MITVHIEIDDPYGGLRVEKTFLSFPADHPIFKSAPGDEIECDLKQIVIPCILMSFNMSMLDGNFEYFFKLQSNSGFQTAAARFDKVTVFTPKRN